MKTEHDTADKAATTKDAAAEKEPTAGEIIAIVSLLIGPLVLAGQAAYWLIYREWFPLPVSRILEWLHIPVPSFSGRGEWIEKFEMVLGAPVSLVLFALAFIVCLSMYEKPGGKDKSEKKAQG